MSDWQIIDNPEWAGRKPRPLKAECHDGSPFITILCPKCGADGHIHETQIQRVPADAEIAFRCSSCGRASIVPPGFFARGFAEMRAKGWIE